MPLIYPGQRLMPRMDPDALSKLGQDLRGAVSDLEASLAPTMRAIAVWWKWYEAIPRTKEKTFPFVGAANVVVPLIGITCDALTSRALAQATAAAPIYWSCRTENEDNEELATNMARYINWQADGNDFSIKHVLSDMLLETFVTGRGACAINYRREVKPYFFGRQGQTMKRQMLTIANGPIVEHVPREHLLWDPRFRIGEAPLVCRKREWSWATIRDMANADEAWDKTAIDSIRAVAGTDGGEDQQIRDVKDELDLRQRDPKDDALHDIREIWVDWSVLGNRFEIPGEEQWGGEQICLLAHVHMRTGKVLRLVGNPYLLPYKPFVDFKFRSGRGVAKRLEMLQQIQTTVWNQTLDARTRANAVWAITRNPRHLRAPLDPSRPIQVDDMDELAPFTLPSAPQQDIPLLVAAQTMAERWMGHSDPLLGRDTRSGGHPAPATSTLALLEQVNVMSAGTDVILQEEMTRIGQAIAMLDQQFENNEGGKLQQVLGAADAEKIGKYLFPDDPIPGNYFFDVASLSRTENPDTKMRRAIMTAQANQNFWGFVLQGTQVIESAQAGPKMKAMWVQAIESMSKIYETFLDASNIDDMERYLVELERVGIDSRNAYQQFTAESQKAALAQRGGAAAGSAGALGAQAAMAGAGNGAQGGAGLPFAGGGVL